MTKEKKKEVEVEDETRDVSTLFSRGEKGRKVTRDRERRRERGGRERERDDKMERKK